MDNKTAQKMHREISNDIKDVGKLLGYPISDIRVVFPPKITDFVPYDRVAFSAMDTDVRIGGYIRYYPSLDSNYRNGAKRAMAWSLMMSKRQAKKYMVLAEHVYNPAYPDRSLLKALLIYYWKSFIYRHKNRKDK